MLKSCRLQAALWVLPVWKQRLFSRTCRNLILKPQNPIKHHRNVFPVPFSLWHCLAASSGITYPKTPVLPCLAQGRAFPAIQTGICSLIDWKISCTPSTAFPARQRVGIRNTGKVQGRQAQLPFGISSTLVIPWIPSISTTSLGSSPGQQPGLSVGNSREEFPPPSTGEQPQQQRGKGKGNGESRKGEREKRRRERGGGKGKEKREQERGKGRKKERGKKEGGREKGKGERKR